MTADQTAPTTHQESRAARILVLVGIVVLAFNLRPSAVSVGPVLDEITHGLGMSGTEAGVLTSLPVLAFASFGALAPRLARTFGAHRLTLLALFCVVVGLVGRSRVDSVLAFLGLSLLALAGMATANVVLPSLVKLHFPDRIGLMTAVYSTALAIGLTSASVFTVPLSETFGGWRSGLLAWALLAAVAALPWFGLVRHDRPQDFAESEPSHAISLGAVARTRLGWKMAVFFGLQSLQAYSVFGWFADVFRDAGYSAHIGGLLLGVITGVSIPLSFVIPSVAARLESQAPLIWALMICYPIGYLGMIFAAGAGAWSLVWAVTVGVGLSTFPLCLTLIGLRAHTPAGTAALSGFTQSVGYLIAAIGPFLVGFLHGQTGGWTVPLVVLLVLAVPQLVVGLMVTRPEYLEDQLA